MRLLLLYPLMCLILNANAWNFTWHDGATVTTQAGNGTIPCTRIYQTKGQPFEYYPNGDAMVLRLWGNTDCSGEGVGSSNAPFPWKNTARTEMRSYMILPASYRGDISGSDTPSASRPAGSGAASTGGPRAPDGQRLSGGAIAGIAVGVVSGIAFLGVGGFFLGRRFAVRSSPSPSAASDPPGAPTAAPGFNGERALGRENLEGVFGAVKEHNAVEAGGREYHPPGELGQQTVVEMSDSHRLRELEGSGISVPVPIPNSQGL
ncbi:uncharacterized protein BDW47DRAFT_124366 [Aspergillus candidus]|uniref:Mid2 domain-containing protein n=1 Tax=Aspergillus candidus TaxID=41067 RepID=A0A2I2FGE2_ASPCN|nr:hypothetical protein BDW47DRAFT_124366 [Aspergillus candidus]PLB39688.1 hypothetical protein BDW47DRAFT_124366 [Aspergillus candidus]